MSASSEWFDQSPRLHEDVTTSIVTVPHLYTPREYQREPFGALVPHEGRDPVKRAVFVWHRRAGKDKTIWNVTITRASIEVGYYLYLFPTFAQAKKAIWMGRGKDKVAFMDHIPEAMIARKNKTDLYIELTNGSIIQLGGSDNYDAYMGTNPLWIVFSEWALCNPVAWDYFRPILVENDGTAVFIYTPRGRNHGYSTYKRAMAGMRADPSRWYASLLSYQMTGVLTAEQVQREVDEEGMSEAKAAQEFECSFDAEVEGAIFGKELRVARAEGRIGFVPIKKDLPVITWWDLGRSDHNAIWFVQLEGEKIRLVHFYQNRLKGMDFYINYVRTWAQEKEVRLHDSHVGPHDLDVHEYTTNRKRIDIARDDHHFDFITVKRTSEEDGISAIRKVFNRLYIDENECETGLAALEEYVFQVKKEDEGLNDELKKTYSTAPLHNWASHACKALQYGSQALDQTMMPGYVDPLSKLQTGKSWDPLNDDF